MNDSQPLDSRTVPLKALHPARGTIQRLKTQLALANAEAAGIEAERAQLKAMLEGNHSASCSACAMTRASRGRSLETVSIETSLPPSVNGRFASNQRNWWPPPPPGFKRVQ